MIISRRKLALLIDDALQKDREKHYQAEEMDRLRDQIYRLSNRVDRLEYGTDKDVPVCPINH